MLNTLVENGAVRQGFMAEVSAVPHCVCDSMLQYHDDVGSTDVVLCVWSMVVASVPGCRVMFSVSYGNFLRTATAHSTPPRLGDPGPSLPRLLSCLPPPALSARGCQGAQRLLPSTSLKCWWGPSAATLG